MLSYSTAKEGWGEDKKAMQSDAQLQHKLHLIAAGHVGMLSPCVLCLKGTATVVL